MRAMNKKMKIINQNGKYLTNKDHVESIIATHEYGMDYTYIDKTKVTILRLGMIDDEPVIHIEVDGL